MQKKIKQWGNSLVIVITREESEILKLKEGDIVRMVDFEKVEKPKNK